jgi:hypothetical protein
LHGFPTTAEAHVAVYIAIRPFVDLAPTKCRAQRPLDTKVYKQALSIWREATASPDLKVVWLIRIHGNPVYGGKHSGTIILLTTRHAIMVFKLFLFFEQTLEMFNSVLKN